MARHMFAGVSSPLGFVDFFDDIMSWGAAARFYLKGPSGSGKSVFMKKAAAALVGAGIETEQFHCANDATSLDAVAAPGPGLCIIDATHPHARDPQLPCVDKIIDFAQFADGSKILKNKGEIISLTKSKNIVVKKAAGYFAALGELVNAEKMAAEAAISSRDLDMLIKKYFFVFDDYEFQAHSGSNRRLFAGAVTPEGPVSFADDLFENCVVYGLCSEEWAGIGAFLEGIKKEALVRGLHCESFYSPLDPGQIEHLYLPRIKTAFVTAEGMFACRKIDKTIELNSCANGKALLRTRQDMERNDELFSALLDEVISLMKSAKNMHQAIESIYAEAMDFEKLDRFTEEFIQSLCHGL